VSLCCSGDTTSRTPISPPWYSPKPPNHDLSGVLFSRAVRTWPAARALLDINVLLALLDSDHVDHQLARDWINAEIQHGWASCAITQNGFVRIISQPRYPSPVPPSHGEERQPHGAVIAPARPGPGSPPGGAV